MHDFRQMRPWRASAAEYYRECLGLIEEAERLGYETVWLSEHHGTGDGFLPAPLVAAAAISSRTTRIKIATNVLVLPLHHPLRVAEDASVVQALSGGRLILGIGQGYNPHEYELFGVNLRHRPSRFEEGMALIRRAWRDGRTGFTGRRFVLPDGPFAPTPTPQVPLLVGAVGPVAVDRAVRTGDGLIVYVSRPTDLPERSLAMTEALERHRRPRDSFTFNVTSVAHVADDADQAWARAAPGIAYLESALQQHPLRAEDLDRDAYLVGTPTDIARRIVNLHRQIPFDHFAFWARLPGLTLEQAAQSQRLLAQALGIGTAAAASHQRP
jgi:alkanesulfonate monooxygenase SsuD/methylene tetrahydromethanopterin reductase-like flavin-dependent oxidoreductase (luciferase family)